MLSTYWLRTLFRQKKNRKVLRWFQVHHQSPTIKLGDAHPLNSSESFYWLGSRNRINVWKNPPFFRRRKNYNELQNNCREVQKKKKKSEPLTNPNEWHHLVHSESNYIDVWFRKSFPGTNTYFGFPCSVKYSSIIHGIILLDNIESLNWNTGQLSKEIIALQHIWTFG